MSDNQLRTEGGISKPQKIRDSNIELFRIITMLLIISHHYVVNSGLTASDGPIYSDPLSWRSLFLLIFGAWGKIGINCFIMITGWFMCESYITVRKFAKLFAEWTFYHLVFAVVFLCTRYNGFSLKEFFKALIPIRRIDTGFTPAFFLFFLLIPFLNILIHNMDEKKHLLLMIWAGFTYVFLGTVPGFSVTMNYVSWFSVIFLIASYIRLYPKKIYGKTAFWGFMTAVLIMLDIGSVISCTWLGQRIGKNISYAFVSDSNTFLAVFTGISAFLFFKNLKIKNSKVINAFGASTFGVLLIHANSDAMRQWLWKDTIDCVGHYDAPLMPLYAMGCVIGIFLVASLIDIVRIQLLEKPFFKLWDKHWDGFLTWWEKVERKFFPKMDSK